MKQNSTLLFIYQLNFSDSNFIINPEELIIDKDGINSIIYDYLEDLRCSPSEITIGNILKYAEIGQLY